MTRLIVLTLGAAAALVLFACSSEEAKTDDGTSSSSGGTSGLGSSGASSGTSSSVETGLPDSGKCQITTLGYDSGTVVTSVPRSGATGGGIAWTDLDNAKTTDTTFAKVVLAAGEESQELRITGFNFKLPANAVFQGVEAQLDRQAPDNGIVDGAIALVGVKNQEGRGKFIATAWPSKIVGTHHYGQPTDTWGMDLNPPDVATADFGVGLWVKRNPDGSGPASATALVDSIKIRVAYCLN